MLVSGLFLKLWKCSVFINTNQTWKQWAKKLEGIKCFQSPLGVHWLVNAKRLDTCRRCRSRSLNCAVVSFLSVFLQKISPFPQRMNPNLVIRLSVVLRGPRSEYQTNKSSLLCTKSSGKTHFWMTHLHRREVVMIGGRAPPPKIQLIKTIYPGILPPTLFSIY